MGSTHFLTRTLKRVSTEMSLHVLAYNIKRVIAIIGVGPLLQAIRGLSARISAETQPQPGLLRSACRPLQTRFSTPSGIFTSSC